MGGASSRPDVAGYRVMRIEHNSPASAASSSWVPYLDVLVAAGGLDLAADSTVLSAQLRKHLGQPLVLTVVNAKSGAEREITVRGCARTRARALPAPARPPRSPRLPFPLLPAPGRAL